MLLLAVATTLAQDVQVERFGRGFVNPWLVTVGDKAMLVDAHYGEHADWLLKKIARAGVEPGQVDLIVVTHGHADHAGGAAALRAVTGATVVVGEGDVPLVKAGHNPPLEPTGFFPKVVALTVKDEYPPFTPDVVVAEDGTLDLHAYGIPGVATVVGGHTPGSLIVTMDDGKVFVGDLIRSHMLRKHRPTEHFFQDDISGVHRTLDGIVDAGSKTLYPGHGKSLDVEDVQRWLKRTEPEPVVTGVSSFSGPALFHLFVAQRQ